MVRIKSALKTLAEEIANEAINNAREQLQNEYKKNHELKSHSDDSDSRDHSDEHVQHNRFIGGVSINVNDQNIFDIYNDGESEELESGESYVCSDLVTLTIIFR